MTDFFNFTSLSLLQCSLALALAAAVVILWYSRSFCGLFIRRFYPAADIVVSICLCDRSEASLIYRTIVVVEFTTHDSHLSCILFASPLFCVSLLWDSWASHGSLKNSFTSVLLPPLTLESTRETTAKLSGYREEEKSSIECCRIKKRQRKRPYRN